MMRSQTLRVVHQYTCITVVRIKKTGNTVNLVETALCSLAFCHSLEGRRQQNLKRSAFQQRICDALETERRQRQSGLTGGVLVAALRLPAMPRIQHSHTALSATIVAATALPTAQRHA